MHKPEVENCRISFCFELTCTTITPETHHSPAYDMQCNIPGLSNTLASQGHAVPARSTLTDEDAAVRAAASKSVMLPATSCIVASGGRCYGFQRNGCKSHTIAPFSDGSPRSPAVMVGSTNLLEAFSKTRWKPPTCLIGIGKVLARWLRCAMAVRLCLCDAGDAACHNGAPLSDQEFGETMCWVFKANTLRSLQQEGAVNRC
jgi:hypothetical protein